MKNLFLIRHAKSSWAEMGMKDFDRSLDERGLRDAPKMAKILRGMGVLPNLIVSSPAKRALTTAQYFATEFGFTFNNIDLQADIYEASESDLLHVIRALPDAAHTVLLFGHNPTLTYFPNRYSKDVIDNVPTCGIVQLAVGTDSWSDFNQNTAHVKEFLYPKMF